MPNWCTTYIEIIGQPEELHNFYNLLKYWTSQDWKTNGFGNMWLGNVVLGSHIGTVDENLATDIACRGQITEYDYILDSDSLSVWTETAWEPMMSMWQKLQEKYIPSGTVYFEAEEPGMGIYQTNEYSLEGKWNIDAWGCDEIESVFDSSEEYVVECLQRLLETKETDVYVLNRMLVNSNIEGIAINQWEYTDIDECL